MNCIQSKIILLLFLFLFVFPSVTYALAGFAEKTSRFHYNDYAEIERGHPSDLCSDEEKWCLDLKAKNQQEFKGIDSTFTQINVPMSTATPHIIGRLLSSNSWLVYNLEQEQVLLMDSNYQKAIELWSSLGLPQPVFVNARNTTELLTETEASIRMRWRLDMYVWLIMVFIPFALLMTVFWYSAIKAKKEYKETTAKRDLLRYYFLLITTLLFLYLILSSFIKVILQNW